MRNASQILNFGSLNVDYVYKVNNIVKPGETVSSLSMQIYAGGKGANQSVAASRAGARVHHAGRIGNDTDGQWMLDEMNSMNIDLSNVDICDEVTGHAVIQVDQNGENSIVLFGGTNQTLNKPFIDKVLSRYGPDTALMLQNEVNELPYLIEQGLRRKMPICFNPSPITKSIATLDLQDLALIVVNEIEGEVLSGEKVPEKMIFQLRHRYPNSTLILTLGSRGSMALQPNDSSLIEIKSQPCKCIDSTAAGDTFVGYVLAGLTRGDSLELSMQHASRAAEFCVGQSGAQSSIPLRSELNL